METIIFVICHFIALAKMDDKSLAKVVRAIADYIEGKTVPALDGTLMAFFSLFQQQIDKQMAAHQKRCEINAQNASGRGKKKKVSTSKKSSKSESPQVDTLQNDDSESQQTAPKVICDLESQKTASQQNDDSESQQIVSQQNKGSESQQIASKQSDSTESQQTDSELLGLEKFKASYPNPGNSSYDDESRTEWNKLSEEEKLQAIAYVEKYKQQEETLPYLNQFLKTKRWKSQQM